MTDMQPVDQGLYRFKLISWRCGKSQNSEIRICRHEESNDSIVCIVAGSPMRFIYIYIRIIAVRQTGRADRQQVKLYHRGGRPFSPDHSEEFEES